MTLRDFEQIIYMKTEVSVLLKRLNRTNNNALVSDYAKDYKTGYGRVITITGYEIEDEEKINKIYNTLENRKKALEEKILKAELFIDSISDSKIRTLMTLRYLEGKEWNDVAQTFYKNMTADSARMTIIRYFENL